MGWLQGSERLEDRCLLSGSANLDQWANSPSNSWQNGNLNAQNSSYAEGNVVPFRVILGNLTPGAHELDINFQSLNSGLHAYDYITTYNTTVPNPPANPLIGTSVPNAPTTAPVQQDPTLVSKGLPPTQGVVTAFNATMTSVNYVSTSSGANQTTFYAIKFSTTAAQTQAVIAWGGHISSQIDWGFGNSASSISGSPYHMAISTLDGASTGSQDRSIKASAVASGFIVVNKVTQPNPADPTLFPFTVSVPTGNTAPAPFSLSGGQSTTLGPFFAGTGFGVTETEQTGWNFVSATASNGTGSLVSNPPQYTLSNFTVPQGNQVSVTYTNQLSATKLVTTATPNGPVTLPGDGSKVTLTDSAKLSGGSNPQGKITFTLQGPGGGVVDTETVPVNGDGTYSTPTGYTLPTSVSVTGGYKWTAAYTPSDNNLGSSDDGSSAAEQVTLNPVTPALVTTATPSGAVTLPGDGTTVTLTDSAKLSGGYFPTGSIVFTLTYTPAGSSTGSAVYTDTVTVSGNKTYDTSTGTNPGGYKVPTVQAVTGSYKWTATYTDNLTPPNNKTASDDGSSAAEQVTLNPASPSVVTTASPNGTVTLGTTPITLTDSAKLSGGYFPVGTITFTLTAPGGAAVYTDHVTVNGNGTYTTASGDHPGGFPLPTNAAPGTYVWTAAYADSLSPANNKPASDPGTSPQEQVTVFLRSQVAPTGTTAAQFANGTSTTLSTINASDDGAGHVAQNVNPGVFFYFSFASAPKAGSFTVTVNETAPNPPSPFLIAGTSAGNLGLYDATGTTLVANGTDLGNGNVSFTATAATPGQVFVVLVKYNSKSIAGSTLPNLPSFTYTWTTQMTQNGATQTQAKGGVTLVNTSFTAGPATTPLIGQMSTPGGSALGTASPAAGTSLRAASIPVPAPDPAPALFPVAAIDRILADPASLLLPGKKRALLFSIG